MDVAAKRENPLSDSAQAITDTLTFGAVDVSWTPPPRNVASPANERGRSAGASLKPSDGLEPSTPSLLLLPHALLVPSKHGELMSQHKQLDVFGELTAPVSDEYPQQSREGEIGEGKQHPLMLPERTSGDTRTPAS